MQTDVSCFPTDENSLQKVVQLDRLCLSRTDIMLKKTYTYSRSIWLLVAPEITMPATRLGQARGRETILECRITAYPHAVNYWEKDRRRIMSSSKHRIDAYEDGENKLTLSLRIVDIDADDYGRYDCVASNALGTDQQTIHLFGRNFYFAAIDYVGSNNRSDTYLTVSLYVGPIANFF